MLALINPFWKFSLAVYARPDVPAECLTLQEQYNLDVNLLLFCAWLGNARQIGLTEDDLAIVEGHVAAWHAQVVRPLRAARQNLKPMPEMADDAVRTMREEIARIELRSEQIEQAKLFEVSDRLKGRPMPSIDEAVRHNVSMLMQGKTGGSRDEPAPRLTAEATAYRSV